MAALGLTYKDSSLRSVNSRTVASTTTRSNLLQSENIETVNETVSGTLTFGPGAAVVDLPTLDNLDVVDETLSGTLTFGPGANVVNFPGVLGSLPLSLQSIGGLPYIGDQMLYTTGTPQDYALSPISSVGRNLVSQASVGDQQATLALVPGVQVQEFSSKLENIATLNTPADNLLYTSSSNTFSASPLSAFSRTVLGQASALDYRDTLDAVQRPSAPLTDRSVSIFDGTDGKRLTTTDVTVDMLDNVSGVNNLSLDGDLNLPTGSIVGTGWTASQSELAQVGNINGATINSTQWGYVGAMDQGVATSDTPTFNGLSANNQRIVSVDTPVSDFDAANKNYVDTVATTGTAPLESVTLATAAVLPNTPSYASGAQTLTSTTSPGGLTVDGVAAAVGNRILVKDQADDRQNGVYDVTDDGASPGPEWLLTRATDFNQAAMPLVAGTSVFVELGTGASNVGTTWALQTTVTTIDPLTDSVVFVQIGGIQTLGAGNGIDPALLAGGTLAVDLTAGTPLTFTLNELDLNTVTVPYGGTGQTSLTNNGVLVGQGASPVDTTKAAPAGDFVGTTDGQTLTNKTATALTNDITARALASNSGANAVSTFAAANPTAGQVLTATGASTATWQTLPPAGAVARTVTVAQPIVGFEGDYATLTAALADIGVGAVRSDLATPASQENPIFVVMNPGAYTETNPLVIPSYVTVSSLSISKGAVLYPSVSGTSFVQLEPNATIFGLTISNFDFQTFSKVVASITVGVEFVGAPTTATTSANYCLVYDAVTGWLASGDGTSNSVIPRIINSGAVALVETMDAGFHATQGASMVLIDCNASGFFGLGGGLTTGFFVDGPNTLMQGTNLRANFCTNGFVVEDGNPGAIAQLQLYVAVTTNMGRPIAPFDGDIIFVGNYARFEAFNMNLRDEGNQANVLYFNSTSQPAPNKSVARVVSTIMNQRKIFVHPNLEAVGFVLGVTPEETQNLFVGELIVGLPNRGYETALGEGDSHVLGMTLLTYNGTTTAFTDVSSAIIGGTSTAIFPSNTAGDIFYIGGDSLQGVFPGIKVSVTTGVTPASGRTNATEPPTYAYTWQYWDGSAWRPLRLMSTNNANFLSDRRNTFNAGSFQYRFDRIGNVQPFFQNSSGVSGTFLSSAAVINGVATSNRWITSGTPYGSWQTTTVNGVLGYWVRVVLSTPLTVVPQVDEIKLHTNRTEINANGYLEFFGDARTLKRLPLTYRSMIASDTDAAQNASLYVGDDISAALTANRMRNGFLRTVALVIDIPIDMDTSTAAILKWRWVGTVAGPAPVQWIVRWAYVVDGAFAPGDDAAKVYLSSATAPTNAATQQTVSFTVPTPATALEQTSTYCQVDMSDMITQRNLYGNGDMVWISLQRDGVADAYVGDVDLFSMTLIYYTSNNGAQI